jgi:predicted ribosome quality control (RQC) complex YloA/Tae2 family protein
VPDPYDLLTVAAVVDELNATIGNGRVQRIGLLDPRTIGAEIYAGGHRHYLIASADDRSPRLRLAPEMPSLDSALVTPFGLLLRKHVRGGIILGIDQPPLERLVRFSIVRRLPPLTNRGAASAAVGEPSEDPEDPEDDDPESDAPLHHVTLYVELMGRHSNLILVDDDGLIMESAKRVTPAMSRVRQILPRLPYLPPPPPDRLDPRSSTPAAASTVLDAADPIGNLADVIVRGWRGVSPLMAREIAFRSTGKSNATVSEIDPETLTNAMRQVLAPLRTPSWSPRIYRQRGDDEPGAVVAFSPTPMSHLAALYDEVPVESVSAGLALAEHALSDDRMGPVRHAQRRQRMLDAIQVARERAERRLAALAGESARAAEADRLRMRGELIYAHLWQIEPGQRELTVGEETIPLDPTLSASENAQTYFERYRKAQSADAQIPALAEESRTEIAYLDQLATLIAQAPGFAELEALAAEWADLGAPAADARPRRSRAPRRPRALVDREGNAVYVGRSGSQNDLVTFDIAGPDDTWLHARGVGGSHVVIRWRDSGTPENESTITAAAALAAWYSAARESGGVEVDVAPRRHVRKIKGARPGMVTYRNERTIRVKPALEEQLREVLRESWS